MHKFKKPAPEVSLNPAHIREQIGHSLRKYYQACMANELSPRLLAVLKRLDEEEGEHVQGQGNEN